AQPADLRPDAAGTLAGRPGTAPSDRALRHVLPLGPGRGRPAGAVPGGASDRARRGRVRLLRRRIRRPRRGLWPSEGWAGRTTPLRRPLGFWVVTTVRLPLFPLNTVLFPGLVLPLNVF